MSANIVNDKFVVSTDGCCDLIPSYMNEQNISFVPMPYIVDGVVHREQAETDEDFVNFYNLLREGKMPTTSQLNAQEMKDYFEKLMAEKDMDIVHVALSSGLSGTYLSALNAAREVMSVNPDRKIYVVDSLSAAYGQAMIVDRAVNLRNQGLSAEEAYTQLTAEVPNLNHLIYIDDLKHLRRGGRISAIGALIGSLLHIKPILTASPKGTLKVAQKTFGINRAFKLITEFLNKWGADSAANPQPFDLYVAHADDSSGADKVIALIKEKFNCVVRKGFLGPVIGSHCGPGAITMYFFGNPRPSKV